MNLRKFFTLSMLAILLVGAIAFAFPGGSVAAQAPTPQPKDPQAKIQHAGLRLEKAFRAEQKLLKEQAQNIARMDRLIRQTEGWIEKAKANGQDTAAVEAAIAQLKTKLAEAKKLHEEAASILKTHTGFDASGKVTDPAAAKETLKSAAEPMKEARTILSEARKAVMEAIKAWREAHPKPTK